MDVLVPSLYSPWSPADNPYLGMPYTTAWTLAAADTLTVAKSFAAQYGIPVAPYVGLRFYHSQPPYLNTYVDAGFFQKMLATVSNPNYSCEGAVFWDWGPFGGPAYANDGTDVWNTSAPWYTSTFQYFSAPSRMAH